MRRMLFLLMFIVLLCFSVNVAAQNRYALLIGIGDYPQDSGWNKIHGDNDVSIIKTLLLQQGFVEDNIMVLKNAEATKSGIESAMDQLPGNLDFLPQEEAFVIAANACKIK